MKSQSFSAKTWILRSVAGTVALAASAASADTFTWIGGTTGSVRGYGTTSNWSPTVNAPPGAADVASFGPATALTSYSASSGISGISGRTIGKIAFDQTPSFLIGTNNNAFTLIGDGSTSNVGLFRSSATLNSQEIQNGLILGNSEATSTIGFDISGSGGLVRLSGPLTNGTGLTSSIVKTGNGVLSVSGANTYTGTTTVSAGALYVNGVTSGNGNYAVAADAIFGGTGTVGLASSSNLLDVNGILNPGNFTATYGTLTVANGNVALHSSAAFDINLATVKQDKLVVGGNLDYGGTLNLAFTGDSSAGGSVDLFDFATYSGSITLAYTGLADGQTASFDPASGIVTIAAATPEPASLALLAGAGGLLLGRRRR